MLSMMFDGAIFSRAFLAVQLAAAEDDHRPILHRAVRIEVFADEGVRLVATDSYWLATCWVPQLDEMLDEPDLARWPDHAVTVRDEDWRCRDLMKHVAKLTRKAEEYRPGSVELHVGLDDLVIDDDAPPLSPDLAPSRALFELPGKERVFVPQIDLDFPKWADLYHRLEHAPAASQAAHSFSGWMLDRFAKLPRVTSADGLVFEWSEQGAGLWTVSGSTRLEHAPHGMFQTRRPAPVPAPVPAPGVVELDLEPDHDDDDMDDAH